MDIVNYLLSHPEEVQQTWYAQGQLTVNSHTKLYTSNSIIMVQTVDRNKELANHFLFVNETYTVDNRRLFDIDWDEMTIDDVTGLNVAIQGIAIPYFTVLPARFDASIVYDPQFIPYNSGLISLDDGGVEIPDLELEACMVGLGFPFLSFSDIELSKREIKRTCIRPGMQRYFSFRPIIREEAYGSVGVGSSFEIEFPPTAYACIPYYTVPGGTGTGGVGSPFSFYNEQMMYAGGGIGGGLGGGRFGKPIRYNKNVPGYAGIDEATSWIDALAARQGYLNFFRREKYKRVRKEDGKFYAVGFSTIGGLLNLKWLCYSNDWNDIPMDEVITLARPMCQFEILSNFAMLRSLVKTDIAGALDPSVLRERADKLDEQIREITKTVGVHGVMAIGRGGG